MSYIDNTKSNMMKEIFILEQENEMLRNQIRKVKIELNELLDRTKLDEKKYDDNGEGTIGK